MPPIRAPGRDEVGCRLPVQGIRRGLGGTRDISGTFAGKAGQYVFISSAASVYSKPPVSYMLTEAHPTVNKYWEYSRNKVRLRERGTGSPTAPAKLPRDDPPTQPYLSPQLPREVRCPVMKWRSALLEQEADHRPRRRHLPLDLHPRRRFRPPLRQTPRQRQGTLGETLPTSPPT